MKYYYINYRDLVLGQGKKIQKINDTSDKIIITEIDSDYHVLIYQNGEFEKEKRVLGFYELAAFLAENKLNTYFVGCNKERAQLVVSTSKRGDYQLPSNIHVLEPGPEKIYAVHDGKVLRTEVYVDREVVKDAILEAYQRDVSDPDDKVIRKPLSEFMKNEEAFEVYHLPFVERNGKLVIPRYSYIDINDTLFYALSGIYHKKGDKINLSEQDLWNLYYGLESEDRDIVDKVVDNIEVKVEHEYSLEEYQKSLEFMETYQRNEGEYRLGLKNAKRTLEKAQGNEVLFNDMYLIKEKVIPVLKKGTINE